MAGSRLNRRDFLAGTGMAAATVPLPILVPPQNRSARARRALVLSGGGARGAYQAGLIDYLRLSRGIVDGQALAPYGFIAGTSIGALNGYFVATAQYSRLRSLWYSIADQSVIRLKAKYAKIPDIDSGVGTRVTAAMRLALGLATHETGVIDGEHLRMWLSTYVDPSRPVVLPFVWTVTNLTKQRPEFFFLVPTQLSAQQRTAAVAAIRVTVGPNAVLREATADVLVDALRASTAIPVAFDPVMLPGPDDGATYAYVDGGVIANTPVGVARAAANRIDVVLLDPPQQDMEVNDALDVGIAVFGAMQRRILEADLRAAYLETYGKRTIDQVRARAQGFALASRTDTTPIDRLTAALYDTDIYQLQPASALPVAVVGFDDRENIYKTFKMGFADAAKGFSAYEYGED
jgi:predicted acylesterase/phospholipase RssA